MKVLPSDVLEYCRGQADTFPLFEDANDGKNAQIERIHIEPVAGFLALIDRVPVELIQLEGAERSEFVVAHELVRSAVAAWNADASSKRKIENGYRRRHLANPLKVLQNLVRKCPDDVVPQSVVSLSFLGGGDLQDDLRRDLSSVEAAVTSRLWKPATIIGGGVIEALLLWLVLDVESSDAGLFASTKAAASLSGDPRDWVLEKFVKFAESLRLLDASDAAVVRQAKDFRNLIHPGRAERLARRCGPDTAFVVLGAIHLLVRRLEDRHARRVI